MYLIGLVILSIAVGHRYDQTDGWMVLGVGMILLPMLQAVFKRLTIR